MTPTARARRLAGAALALAMVLALPQAALAQARKADDIKYPPLPEFNVPTPQRVVLDNGLVVMLLEDHELPLVDATVRVRTGSRLEPADKVGLAGLVGTVMRTGGTTSMSPDELDDYLEGKAATVETFIGGEIGGAGMNCLKEDLPEVLKVLADVLRNPVFAEDRIEVAKNQVNAGIARQNDDPQGILFREFEEVIYGDDSPYARQETYASIAGISRDDMVAWHRQYFHPNRMILGLVGDFDSARALALIKEVFGAWPMGPAATPVDVPYKKEPSPGVYYVEKNDMTQSNIIMGHLGIRRDNPDYYAVEVMNEVLSGGFASRLFSEVRSRKGLAYAVRGGVGSEWDHEGALSMFMTTKTETTGAGIEALLEEAGNMTAKPPTDEEVRKAKSGILNSFVFRSDSNRQILGQQVTYEYYGYPLDWLSRYRDGIEQVTTAQVREVAAKHIKPAQFSIMVVGPTKGQDKPLSTYGTVTAVDITIPEPEAAKVAVTEEDRKKGAALLARMVDAAGGAEAIDAIVSMQQASDNVATTPQGEMSLKSSSIMVFPDKMRQDLTLPFGKVSTVITAEDAFLTTPQGTQVLPDSQRADGVKVLRRNPIFLLKSRARDGFEVAALGQEDFGGKSAELLQVAYMDETVTLAVDAESGLLLGLKYQGKDFTGAPGEIVQSLSDYRDVSGLQLPFKVVQTFNGNPMLSSTMESIAVNPEIAADAFTRPQAEAAGGGGR